MLQKVTALIMHIVVVLYYLISFCPRTRMIEGNTRKKVSQKMTALLMHKVVVFYYLISFCLRTRMIEGHTGKRLLALKARV